MTLACVELGAFSDYFGNNIRLPTDALRSAGLPTFIYATFHKFQSGCHRPHHPGAHDGCGLIHRGLVPWHPSPEASIFLMIGVGTVLAAATVWAIVSPHRGLPDVCAGTHIVPR